jgi:hypothetical protein
MARGFASTCGFAFSRLRLERAPMPQLPRELRCGERDSPRGELGAPASRHAARPGRDAELPELYSHRVVVDWNQAKEQGCGFSRHALGRRHVDLRELESDEAPRETRLDAPSRAVRDLDDHGARRESGRRVQPESDATGQGQK